MKTKSETIKSPVTKPLVMQLTDHITNGEKLRKPVLKMNTDKSTAKISDINKTVKEIVIPLGLEGDQKTKNILMFSVTSNSMIKFENQFFDPETFNLMEYRLIL